MTSIRHGLIAALATAALLGAMLEVGAADRVVADLSISSVEHAAGAPAHPGKLAISGAAIAVVWPAPSPGRSISTPARRDPARAGPILALAPKTSPPRRS